MNKFEQLNNAFPQFAELINERNKYVYASGWSTRVHPDHINEDWATAPRQAVRKASTIRMANENNDYVHEMHARIDKKIRDLIRSLGGRASGGSMMSAVAQSPTEEELRRYWFQWWNGAPDGTGSAIGSTSRNGETVYFYGFTPPEGARVSFYENGQCLAQWNLREVPEEWQCLTSAQLA